MNKFIKLFACIVFFASLTVLAKAQSASGDWMRLQSDNAEVSFEMPKNTTYFYDADGFVLGNGGRDFLYSEMQMLTAASDKTVMSVEVYKASSPKNQLNLLIEIAGVKASKLDAPANFFVKQFEKTKIRDFSNEKDVEISFVSRFIATKQHIYVFTAANRGKPTPALDRFMSSIRFNPNQAEDAKISSLMPLKIENIFEASVAAPKDLPKTSDDLGKPSESAKNPTPILIMMKPRASYTSAARQSQTTGNIKLRVTFGEDGRLSKIALISGLPDGLNRNAFFSALRIKFIPEEKDGKFETVKKHIEYSFAIY